MIKALTTTVFSLTMLAMTSLSVSANVDDTERPRMQQFQDAQYLEQRKQAQQQRHHYRKYDANVDEHRRSREERGMKRLKQHQWQPGYTMPQHYRSNSYKVSYQQHDLPKPSRQQQWYRVNDEFILINSVNHNIIQIIKH